MAAGSDRVLYLGTGNGLFQATPNGGGYQARPLGLQGKGPVKYPVVDVEDPRRLYAGTSTDGMWRSEDGGQMSHTVTTMPDNPQVVIATSGGGFFRSENGGASFEPSDEGLSHRYMAHVAVNPKRPNVLYTAAAEVPPPFWRRPTGANAAFFRSENQGKNWRKLSGGLPKLMLPAPRAVAGDAEDPDAMFVGMMDGSVWMSEDGGESFRQIVTGLPMVGNITVAHR